MCRAESVSFYLTLRYFTLAASSSHSMIRSLMQASLSIINTGNQQQHSLSPEMDDNRAMGKKFGTLPLYQEKHESSFSRPPRISRLPSSVAIYLIAGITAFLFVTYRFIRLSSPNAVSPQTISTQPTDAQSNHTGFVPLEAHVMSKCPDAKTCLEELVVPAMEQVVDMVDFRLSYIGSIDDNDTLRTCHSQIKP